MATITGLTANSKKNFQLDAGALYKNYQPGTDTPASASAKLIGATVGGATLSVVPEVREIEVDGSKGNVKGLTAIDSWTCTLSANVKEVTKDSVALALGTYTSTSATNWTKLTPKETIADADYLTNVTWVGKISGSNNPMMIVMKNVLCKNGFTFQVSDKSEGNIPLVLTAHYDVADLDSVPVEIYQPTIA